MGSLAIAKNTKKYICEVGVDRHFTKLEWELVISKSWNQIEHLTKLPIQKFCDLVFYKSLLKHEKCYVNYLLLYQRVTWSLDDTLSVKFFSLPLKKIHNFNWIEDKLETHFVELFKLDINNEYKKEELKIDIMNLVFCIWAAGYGLLKNEGRKYVDDDLLMLLKAHTERKKNFVRRRALGVLSVILEREKETHIKHSIYKKKIPKSYIDLVKNRWKTLLCEVNTELAQSFYDYSFDYMLPHVKDIDIKALPQPVNRIHNVRSAIRQITLTTWVSENSNLKRHLRYINSFGINTPLELISGGLNKVLIHISRSSVWDRKKINHFRFLLKKWLTYYIWKNELNLVVNTIIPTSLKRKTSVYGKVLSLGSAYTLIHSLLDEQSPYINENGIYEFRCRRACLIQLATGSRVTEVCLLLKGCITTDHHGNKWLHLHKTKNGKPRVVKANEDIQNWIDQSAKFAPKYKIYSARNNNGDGLTEYRIFANKIESNALTNNDISKFLIRLQKRIWPEKPKSEYFTSHDLRRMHAIYMVMKNKSKHEIQDQLGHSSPNSLIPYIATSSPEIQQYYSEIYKEGVWGNIVNKLEEPTDLELDPLLEQAAKVVEADDKEQFISSLIEKFKNEEAEFGFSNDTSFMPINNVSAGFPRFTHNCVAHEMLNCGHTELHCFKCDYYKPDDDKYNEHIAEIFRFMLLALRGEEMAKSKRDSIQKELVSIRSNDIIELIDESFPKLLEKKFSITPREIPKLKKGLWDKAKGYWKKYKQTKPILTFEEALQYLKEGKLEWVGKEALQ